MSRVAKYDTSVIRLSAILTALRAQRPAPTIRATASARQRTYTSDNQERGQATIAVGRATSGHPHGADATRLITVYAVGQALTRHAAEDPPMFAQLVAAVGYPTAPKQEGGEDRAN